MSDDRQKLVAIYTRLNDEASPLRRIGYHDILQQQLYFEILTAIGIPSTASILDVGCGRGDLYAWLHQRGYRGRYIGVDLTPHLIAQAARRFPQVEFIAEDVLVADLPACDYALAAGPFDYRTPHSQERWRQIIARMFELARCGIAWNGIYSAPPERADLWIQPLPMVAEMCAQLSPYYTIRCDYDPPHFTAYVYRREHFISAGLQALIGRLYLHPEYAQQLQNDPQACAAEFGVSLQQLNIIAPLWAGED